MDLRSNSFLIVTIAMFAIAVYAFVEGIPLLGILFALFGVGGLAARFAAKKKK